MINDPVIVDFIMSQLVFYVKWAIIIGICLLNIRFLWKYIKPHYEKHRLLIDMILIMWSIISIIKLYLG